MLQLNNRAIISFFLVVASLNSYAQNKEELKQKKEVLEEEIKFTNELLKQTKTKKKTSLNHLKVLNNRITNQKKLAETISIEIMLSNKEITKIAKKINTIRQQITQKSKHIEALKAEYAKMIYSQQRNKLNNNALIFIISSDNFNQAYKRINYLKQYSVFRKKQATDIKKRQDALELTQKELIDHKESLNKLKVEKKQKINEKRKVIKELKTEEKEKEDVLRSLTLSEKKFKKELEDKQKIKRELNQKIRELIEEEIRKARRKINQNENLTNFNLTPESKELSDEFEANKGKLPWPLAKGVIVQTYGKQKHEVFESVETFNNGIDIATEKNAVIRSVFDGHISRIFFIKGEGKAILINHGEYFTVYSGLKQISVKVGEKIFAKEKIGVVLTQESDNKTELHFEIWKGYEKQDPSKWLFNAY